MNKIMSSTICTILLCEIVFFSLPALADKKNDAKKHFEAGMTLLEAEDYDAAAAEFETSLKAYPTKNGFFNLANCLKAMHRYGEALDVVARFEAKFSGKLDLEWREEIRGFKRALNAVVGKVSVKTNHKGAAVNVDGRKIGLSPLNKPIVLGPGEHEIEVSLDGYATENKKVKIQSGSKINVQITLKPVSSTLSISCNVKGADVYLNDEHIGTTPLSRAVELSSGKYRVMLKKVGYISTEQRINLKPGADVSVGFSMSSESATVAAPPYEAQPASEPETQPETDFEVSNTKKGIEEDDKRGLSPLFWTGLIGTVVTGAVSGIFFGVSSSHSDDFNNAKSDFYWASDEISSGDTSEEIFSFENESWNTMEDEADQVKTFRALGVASAVTAGAFAVLMVVGLVVSSSGEETDSSNGVAVIATPGGVSVSF